ncbi:MAG: hypothetical protein ACFFB2_06670 [Promethearchaeota archaeon]
MQDESQFIDGLFKTAINYSKRYIYRTISDLLREWSLDELLEDSRFRKF